MDHGHYEVEGMWDNVVVTVGYHEERDVVDDLGNIGVTWASYWFDIAERGESVLRKGLNDDDEIFPSVPHLIAATSPFVDWNKYPEVISALVQRPVKMLARYNEMNPAARKFLGLDL